MMIIGITGPTGAGKTTALEVLGSMGFEIVDCDALYYELLRTSLPLRRALEDAFGPVFLPDGQLDRRTLAARVFTAPEELQRLNGIVFPAVRGAVEEKIFHSSQKRLAIDAVNLVESGIGALCGATVAVTAAPEVRLRRIMSRDGLSEDQAGARIAAQKPDSYYRALCSHVVENRTEDRPAFERQVRGFFAGLIYGEEHKNIMEAKEWKEKVLTQKKNGYEIQTMY